MRPWLRSKGSAPEGDPLLALARAHLSPDVAARWLGLLRPAIRLIHADSGQPVVARLGGLPVVPTDFAWPTWEGHGPLTFVGEVDLDALSALGLDPGVRLPSSGRLLAFYFDGSYDDFEGIVGTWDRESLAGARLIHLRERRADCTEAATPPRVLDFTRHDLTGQPLMTFPNWEHPALRREFDAEGQEYEKWLTHPVNADPFREALWELRGDEPGHQIGGWADPVQGPVEFEVAQAVLVPPGESGDARLTAEALAWSLLLQVDSDDASDMMWGDVGVLYWLTRADDQAEDALGEVSFTWQCS